MEMNEIINHIGLKIGEITEIDPDNRTRVLLKDLETKEETPWCNFLFSYAGNGKGIFLDHAIGDKVLFTLFSDEQGFIFGQYYAKGDTVPGSENNDILHQIDSSNFLGVDKVSKTLKCNYDNVELGQSPTEKAVLGDQLKSVIEDLIDILKNSFVVDVPGVTAGSVAVLGTTNTATGTLLDGIVSQLSTILATQVKVK